MKENLTINALLRDELSKFFADKRFDMTQVVDSIYDSILSNINCDYEKFILALSQFRLSRNGQSFSDVQKQNVYDLSSQSSSIYIKEILDENKEPILLFFKNNENLPYFKIISYLDGENKSVIIETSNDANFLTNIKNKENNSDYSYVFRDEFLFDDKGSIIAKKNVFAKSGRNNGSNEVDASFLENNEFFAILMQLLAKNDVKMPNCLSEEQIQMLQCFYLNVNSIFASDIEFGFNDLLMLLKAVCIDESKKSKVNLDGLITSNFSEMVQAISSKCGGQDRFNLTSYSSNGEPVNVKVSIMSKYLNIDIFDELNRKLCGYMIYETDRGFTLFRSLKDVTCKSMDILDSCTLNLSDDSIKFSAIGDKKRLPKNFRPVDIELRFKNDGEIIFGCASAAEFKNQLFEFESGQNVKN